MGKVFLKAEPRVKCGPRPGRAGTHDSGSKGAHAGQCAGNAGSGDADGDQCTGTAGSRDAHGDQCTGNAGFNSAQGWHVLFLLKGLWEDLEISRKAPLL